MIAPVSCVAGGVLFVLAMASPAIGGAARSAQPLMGSILEVTILADDTASAQRLADRCFEVGRHWEDVLTTWRPHGELERLNSGAGRGRIGVSKDLASALGRMLSLSSATRGAFNPAVGGIIQALRSGQSAAVPVGSALPLAEALSLFPASAAELRQGIRLDAGGIGKGIALDAIAELLDREGGTAWFLDFGGSSQLAHGRPEGRDAWLVAVGALDSGRVHGAVAIQNAAISTSRAVPEQEASGAIVDPRCGRPVSPPRLATVIAADATSADAWSTALIVLGREGFDAARAAGVQALYEDLSGTVVTDGFPLLAWPETDQPRDTAALSP